MAEVGDYRGAHITIKSDGQRCIHSRFCVLDLPSVFEPNAKGPWIHPDAASAASSIATITRCPSGALSYEPVGDVKPEQPPGANSVRVWENGPLAFHAELNVAGDSAHYRATLCRCGKSNHKPYCDGMHRKSGFKATGEPLPQKSDSLAVKNGPLTVTPTKNGPLHAEGSLEICAASGLTVSRTTEIWLCRCGHSQNKPFCDGSHEKTGFKADGE